MTYNIDTMNEVALLKLLLEIKQRKQTGFIDSNAIQQKIAEHNKAERRSQLNSILQDFNISKEELLHYIQQKHPSESEPNGIKTVQLTQQQQKVLSDNLNRECNNADDKLKALIDKYSKK